MNKFFWKNKNVLITGHTGFKGSWLSFWLKQKKAKVSGISLREKKQSFFNYLNLKKIIDTNIYCNINNYKNLSKHIKKINPEIVFHLAAQPLVIRSYNFPLETIETNIVGTSNLLKIIKECKKLKVIIIVTSDKCYEAKVEKNYVETDKLGGSDIYSASKACTEIISNAFRETYFKNSSIKLATVRAGNVIGGGDFSENRIMPDIIRSHYFKKDCIIRNQDFIRPWQHILDPLNGYIKLAEKLYFSNKQKIKYDCAWNFGPFGKKRKVIDLVLQAQKYFKIKKIVKKKSNIKETKNLFLNSSKANKYLAWRNKINFEKMIKLTSEWYLNYKNKKKIFEITKKQISQFENEKN